MEKVKTIVHALTNHIQCILSYLEMEEYKKALEQTKITIKELWVLKKMLHANVMALPKHSVVVVPKGTPVVETKSTESVIKIVDEKDAPKRKPN